MFVAAAFVSAGATVYANYKAHERYQFGWATPLNGISDLRSNWEPTWEHCEVCDRETPHKKFPMHSFCIYTDLVHGDYEWSYYSNSYILKGGKVEKSS